MLTFAVAHWDAASCTCSRARAVAPPKARPSLAITFDGAGTLFRADLLGSLSSLACVDAGGSAVPSMSDGAVTPSSTLGSTIVSVLG